MNILVPIIYTIIGGFLGFCGALIVEWYKRKRLEKDFKGGLCAELREALPRFVLNYYLLNKASSKINRDMLNWTYSIWENATAPKKAPAINTPYDRRVQ